MGLHVTGKVLGVVSENVTSPTGAFADFVSTTIHLLDGLKTTEVRVGRDFDRSTLAEVSAGDLLNVEVFMSKGRLYGERITERVPAEQAARKAS